MKSLLSILLLFLSINIFGQSDSLSNMENDDGIWGPDLLTKEVKFIGNESINDYVNHNLSKEIKKYILANHISGKLYVMMTVDSTGKVINAAIQRGGLDSKLDEDILQILKLTSWEPAIYAGTPISRRFVLPIDINNSKK